MTRLIFFLLLVFSTNSGISQNNVSVDELQSDAKLLWQALNELHPGLSRHTDTTLLTKAYEHLLLAFSTDMSAQEAFLHLSKFTSKIKCGHTYLNPFNQRNDIISSALDRNVLLPFTFSILDRKIVVEKSFTEDLKRYDIITNHKAL